jgi:hypothetical protein
MIVKVVIISIPIIELSHHKEVWKLNIVTCIPIARQRLGKQLPAVNTLRPFLYNGAANTPETIRDNRRRCFPWCQCKLIRKENSAEQQSEESSFETPACRDTSLGVEELNGVDKNGKKGIKRCNVGFMCDLKRL